MTFEIVKLHFYSPLHIAKGKPGDESGDEILRSDALKSAIFAAAADAGLHPDANQIADEHTDNHICPFLDAFTLSSAFPFLGQEYFFPKPQTGLPDFDKVDDNFNQHKEKKAIRYIGKSLFEKLFSNKDRSWRIPLSTRYDKKYLSETNLTAEYILTEDMTMRVAVPRDYSGTDVDARPYYTGRLHFYNKTDFFEAHGNAEDQLHAGLYFFVQCDDPKIREKLKIALDVLGDNGIGTDRTTGNGCFTAEWTTMDLKIPKDGTHSMLLSLYSPAITEINYLAQNQNFVTAYTLIKRGGWISNAENEGEHTTYRKRSVYMFEEGSVLPQKDHHYKGVLHDLRPDIMGANTHPVWRDGRAFSLPFNPLLP